VSNDKKRFISYVVSGCPLLAFSLNSMWIDLFYEVGFWPNLASVTGQLVCLELLLPQADRWGKASFPEVQTKRLLPSGW